MTNFMNVQELSNWLERVEGLLQLKMRYAVEKARRTDFVPYSTRNGEWAPTQIDWWTNGFWPAEMWQMYRMTGDAIYRDEAVRVEEMLDAALRDFQRLHHDVGFMWLIHSGVRYALEGNSDSRERTLFAAYLLASRYNPFGFIRAWNGVDNQGWAIIDCMMNLPLLYWASRETGDPRFQLIAQRHADTTMEAFVRADGSCNHIVCFDPLSGDVLDRPGGQGYASGSSWSRGQAWALYGFSLSYLLTGKEAYLNTAKRVAHYFISSVQREWIPPCDFRAPQTPAVWDDAAGSIAASGLLELARLVPTSEQQIYRQAAICLLTHTEERHADWTLGDPAILTHCTSAYHDPAGRHIRMTYADYFLIEAVRKLRGETMLFWNPIKTASRR
ncbi:glycoside hydrolase family 88 protein [Beduinella massiliensis]|uniref:glycoside hydrolase family 88 protein n=1 Tax=Beduinella massiliensis TaxID=1852363 RepID=UPI000C85239E